MNEDYKTTRGDIEDDILEQIRDEIRETILHHAPESWSQKKRDSVEESVLGHSKLVLAALSTNELQSVGALRTHIAQAEADTKRLIRGGGVK